MKAIKNIILGLILGTAAGLWIGVNIGKGKPILSNPLAEPDVRERLQQTGKEILQKSGEVIEKGGDTIKKKLEDQP